MSENKIQLLGLSSWPARYVDTSNTSPNYLNIVSIPEKLTAGKNIIKIKGNSANLDSNSNVYVEIVDFYGDPIVHKVLDYLDDDGTINLQIDIKEQTAPGLCTIYIMVSAINIPELNQYNLPSSDVPNVKWARQILVSPLSLNQNEILFLSSSLPSVFIQESVKPYYGQSFKTSRIVNVSGSSTLKLIVPGTTKKSFKQASNTTGQTRIGSNFLYKVIQPNPTITNNRIIADSTLPIVIENNTLPTLKVTSGNFVFSSSMVGGTITVNQPVIDTIDGTQNANTTYTATIVNILNETTAHVVEELNYNYNGKLIRDFDSTPFTCSYIDKPIFATSENYQSYVDVNIHNIKPASGDVYKIRTYVKPVGATGEYRMINETVLSQQDILVDTGSLTGENKIGEFESISDITAYWNWTDAIINPPAPNEFYFPVYDANYNFKENGFLVQYNRSKLNDSMYLYYNGISYSEEGDFAVVKLQDAYYPKLYKGDTYVLSLNASADEQPNTLFESKKVPIGEKKSPTGWIDVYVSGSAVDANTTLTEDNIQTNQLGKYLGSVFVNNGALILDKTFSFQPDRDGTITVLFAIRSGNVYIANIHIYPETTIGKSPNRIRLQLPLPKTSINAEQQFKFQYLNYEGTAADYTTEIFGPVFSGSNSYIEGELSMITGSLYVADSLYTGIGISGYKNTGYIRSLGYNGFNAGNPGFLLWSGSALPLSTTTYQGVGLELYANTDNYFRFRTNPSELDVHTQTFFLGSSSNFISGSNGNIRISGSAINLSTSNFFLGNNTTFISGSNGNIKISGSNLTLSTPNFFLGDSNSFVSGSNGKLQVSSSNFIISAQGAVTASDMYLENVAVADGFVYNTITINSSNYQQYYENYTITNLLITGSAGPTSTRQFTKLVLNGSLGGQQGKQVRIERLPDYPIGMIVPAGYSPNSTRGFDVTIENWALNSAGTFSAIPFASLVASSSSQLKGEEDFSIFSDMWDKSATSFRSQNLNYFYLGSLSTTSASIHYGEGTTNYYSTYDGLTALSSQVLLLYYGNQFTFQRTVASTPAFGLQSNYFQLVYNDSYLTLQQYFPAGFKAGGGVVMGGQGASNPFSRTSAIHTESTSSIHAVLDLRADTSFTNDGAGEGFNTVLLPPRFSNTFSSSIYSGGYAPPEASMYFNTTTKKLMVYNGTKWDICNATASFVEKLNQDVTISGSVLLQPKSNGNDVAIWISGSNTVGGSNYIDFLRATNRVSGGTNVNKTFRLNNTGAVEIVDSAYTTVIFSLTDAGVLSTPGGGTSDSRVKNNIIYISSSAASIIDQLKPVSFQFNNYPGITRHGFIAQDVLQIKSDLVLGDGDKDGGTYGLDYDGILALTVKALQEANSKINQLESELQTIKTHLGL